MQEENDKPLVWIVDSERAALGECLPAFDRCCSAFRYLEAGEPLPFGEDAPDAILFSAEIAGGPEGERYLDLRAEARGIPLIAVAKVRSLAQAVAFFRAGVNDYLSLPLDPGELSRRLEAARYVRAYPSSTVLVEVEGSGSSAGTVVLDRAVALEDRDVSASAASGDDEDILAHLSREEAGATPDAVPASDEPAVASGGTAEAPAEDLESAEPVDGLPIPSLWEELPCGLAVFDSMGNLVFSNSLALDLFGMETLADLQEALENGRHSLGAMGQNRKPLPDNRWPHVAAVKAKAARSAVVSLERPDRRRVWLRIDCLPHLTDGKVSRLCMTLVNMTGDLPPPAASRGGKKAEKR
jgi:DNA-binding NarL/FixJ family response regulator